MRTRRLLLLLALTSCAPPGPARPPSQAPTPVPAPAVNDSGSANAGLVPAGFGTLRQDEVALRLDVLSLQVRALPLEESILRTLASDSYRALRDLRESQGTAVGAIARRTGTTQFSLWYVSFFSAEPGETRFSPMDLVVTNVGRDFRPLGVLALTPGFGQHRVRQRETHSALYVFDGQLDANQPLVVTYETARNSDWAVTLQRIDRERILIRSRARS
ncbi:MAG: hypothetical protein ACT4P6_21250 [Gemmatimonadaceae bacterium]